MKKVTNYQVKTGDAGLLQLDGAYWFDSLELAKEAVKKFKNEVAAGTGLDANHREYWLAQKLTIVRKIITTKELLVVDLSGDD